MPRVDRNILKAYFNTGDTPTEGQFCNLIESQFNFIEDGHLLGLSEFDENRNYPMGSSVVYMQEIYKALIDITPGPFNPVEWEQISTDDQEADEVAFDGTASGLSATNVQDAIDEVIASKGLADGIAPLDSLGKIPATHIPSIAITNVYVVNDIAERDALTVEEGDVAVVLDAFENTGDDHSQKTFIYEDTVGWLVLEEPPGNIQSLDDTLSIGNNTEQSIVFEASGQPSINTTLGYNPYNEFEVNSLSSISATTNSNFYLVGGTGIQTQGTIRFSGGQGGHGSILLNLSGSYLPISFELSTLNNNALMTGSTIDYAADYSGSYNNRSLVDKEYVDGLIGAANELDEVLANGNTTGGNHIIMSDDDTLRAANGGSEINLWNGANKDMYWSTDGASLGEAYVSVIHDSGTTSQIELTTSDSTPGSQASVALNADGPVESSSIEVTDTRIQLDSNLTTINGNVEVNPSSSFIIGNGIGIDFNNGVNAGTLNASITSAQSWILPDQTGTIALTSDIVAATQDLQSVLNTGSSATGIAGFLVTLSSGDFELTTSAGDFLIETTGGGYEVTTIGPGSDIQFQSAGTINLSASDTVSISSSNNNVEILANTEIEITAQSNLDLTGTATAITATIGAASLVSSNDQVSITGDSTVELTSQSASIDINANASVSLVATNGGIQMSLNDQSEIIDNRTAGSTAGLEYFADYSAGFTNRSLVDKAYVDSQASGASIYSTNGTLSSGRTVTLGANNFTFQGNDGGTVTNEWRMHPTSDGALNWIIRETDPGNEVTHEMNMNTTSGWQLQMSGNAYGTTTLDVGVRGDNVGWSIHDSSTESANWQLNSNRALMDWDEVGTNNHAEVGIFTSGQVHMLYEDGSSGNSTEIFLDSSSLQINDTLNSKGMAYGGDYSTAGIAAYGDRWIVDKGYVDSQVSASNELSEVLSVGNQTGGTNIVVDEGDSLVLSANPGTGGTILSWSLDGGASSEASILYEDSGDQLLTFDSSNGHSFTGGQFGVTASSVFMNPTGSTTINGAGITMTSAITNQLNLRTTNADINLSSSGTGDVVLSSGSGNIELNAGTGEVQLPAGIDTRLFDGSVYFEATNTGIRRNSDLIGWDAGGAISIASDAANVDLSADTFMRFFSAGNIRMYSFTEEILWAKNLAGFTGSHEFAGLTANRAWTWRDQDGTVAFLSDLTAPDLSSVLTTGNTTGGNNVVTSNGDGIAAASGGGFLDLRADGGGGANDNRVFLVNDGGSFTKEGIWMEDNYSAFFVAGFNSYLEFDNTLATPKSTWQNTVGDIDLKASGDFLLEATAITLKKPASAFTGEFTFTNTVNRTYTLPDNTGTVALLSDITAAAQDLQSVLDEGATGSITGPISMTSAVESIILNAGGLLNLDGATVDIDSSSGDIDITSAAAVDVIASGAATMTSQTSTVDITSDIREVNINATLGNVIINSAGGDAGVGTASPNTKLDVDGDFAIRYNNVSGTAGNPISLIGSDRSAIRTDFSGGTQSIVAISGGADGKEMVITNVGNNITLVHEDAGSVAANRMNMGSFAGNITVQTGDSAVLKYDATSSRWRLISITA